MIIFPAIDLYGGKAVRLYKGDYSRMTVYSDSPLEVAKDFWKKGAEQVHIVDLMGARDGGTPNLEMVKEIIREIPFVEIGGGIRTMEAIASYIDAGASRVILGTAALENRELLAEALRQYGEKIAVGADIREGCISVKGWTETSSVTVDDFFADMEALGVCNIICTDISKDGAMSGTNRELYSRLSHSYSVRITASGGVSTLDDVCALRKMGLYGAIIGKAKGSDRGGKMITKRIIPCLDIRNGRVVKGTNFKGLRDVSDPVELAEYYSQNGADELVFYDITASFEGRQLFTEVLKKVASAIFIPLTVGGGIGTLEDFENALRNGADKVSVNSGVIRNPGLVGEAAKRYGDQCVVLSADVKRVGNEMHIFAKGGREDTGLEAIEWIKRCVGSGAGEVVVNSIDTDGVKNGFDLEMLSLVCRAVEVPVIASGGAGCAQHFVELFQAVPGVDAGLAASVFHFGEVRLKDLKKELAQNGIHVRI